MSQSRSYNKILVLQAKKSPNADLQMQVHLQVVKNLNLMIQL